MPEVPAPSISKVHTINSLAAVKHGGEHVEHVTNGVAPMESGRIARWATKDSSRSGARGVGIRFYSKSNLRPILEPLAS